MDLVARLSRSIRGGLIIAGTTIGAGMLGIPMLTASCGFAVATLCTVIVWAFMLVTGLLLLEVSLTMNHHANFISIARRYLGNWGGLFTGGLFVFLYVFLLVAYFAAGSPLIQFFSAGFFNIKISDGVALLIFAGFFGSIVATGPKMIDTANLVMTIFLSFLLVLLLAIGMPEVKIYHLTKNSFNGALFTLPILCSAFGFHNLIPSLVNYMDRDKQALKDAIIIGTTIPLVVYTLWQMLVLGAIPVDLLKDAANKGVTATTLFAQYSHKPWITVVGQFFSFFAITTSVLGVSFSLVDFVGDALKLKPVGKNRIFLTLTAFAVPLCLTMIDKAIFIRALSIAGGFGEALLNGVIPVALVYSMRYLMKVPTEFEVPVQKPILYSLIAFAMLVFGVELWHLIA